MTKKRFLISALALSLVLAALFNFSSCKSTGSITAKVSLNNLLDGFTARKTEKVDLEKVENKYLFATELFRNTYGGGNTMISPLSVMCALAMTLNGAKGETKEEMEKALGMSCSELNAFIKTLTDGLDKDGKLGLANSVWIKDTEDFSVSDDFLQTVKDYYSAGVFKREFNEETKEAINEWVESNTDGMIKNVLDRISADAVMFLVNAIVFKSAWEVEYKETQIRDGKFYGAGGNASDATYLTSDENIYLSGDGFVGFEKPYKDGRYAFVALLPDAGVGVGELVASLDAKKYAQIFKDLSYDDVYVEMPKFKSEFNIEMNDVLKKMGIEKAFSYYDADFGGLGNPSYGRIYMNRVIHKTFIELDEEGTKAAGATVIEMGLKSAMPVEERKEVILDRPFVYMIVDTETNIPLFMGTMENIG